MFAIKTLEGITNTSTGKIYDLLNLPNNNRTYLVIFRYNAYTFANSSSIYMFANGTTTHCYGVDCIYKGSESRTVVLDSDGTVHTGAANTYNMQAFYKPIT